MSKHTLGPWEASEGYPSDIWRVDMPSRGYSVVVSRAEEDWDMAVEEVQANAHLIAAAPELLALAERLAETVKLCHDCKWDVLKHELIHLMTGLESEAKEAIEKAKGGE